MEINPEHDFDLTAEAIAQSIEGNYGAEYVHYAQSIGIGNCKYL